MTPEEVLKQFPDRWLEFQRSPEYKEKIQKMREIAAMNEGIRI